MGIWLRRNNGQDNNDNTMKKQVELELLDILKRIEQLLIEISEGVNRSSRHGGRYETKRTR